MNKIIYRNYIDFVREKIKKSSLDVDQGKKKINAETYYKISLSLLLLLLWLLLLLLLLLVLLLLILLLLLWVNIFTG